MSTGLDTFDKTVQESNLWLKDVMERLNTNDRHHAYSTLRAVLHALRDRIGPESAAHLGAQLPMLLRGLFYEGWDPTGKPTKERHETAFLPISRMSCRVPRRARWSRASYAVFDVISKRIDRGAAVKLAGMFPRSCANSGRPSSRRPRGSGKPARLEECSGSAIRPIAARPNIVRRTRRTRGRCSAALALLSL